jgi:hypothetical protein
MMVTPMQRLVHRIPLDVLWDDEGEVDASRERWLSKSLLREMLQKYPVEFVVADVGHPLRRIDVAMCYSFWSREVCNHLVDDPAAGFRLEAYRGDYAYIASEWSGNIHTPIVLLEKYH